MKEFLDRFSSKEKFIPDSIHACKEYVRIKGFPEPIGPKSDQ